MSSSDEAEAGSPEGREAAKEQAPRALSLGRLFKNASIYGLGQALGSILTFFTDPILSHLLTRADFGLLGLTRTTGNLLSSFYRLGLDGAANRIYYDVEGNEIAQRRTLGTINSFLLVWVVLLSLGQELLGPTIYAHAFDGLPYAPYGRFVAYALACNTLVALAQMVWGAQERAKLLTGLRIVTLLLTTAITFGLLLGPKLGVLSVYIGQAVGPTLLVWVHLRFAWGRFGFAWDPRAIRSALVFGLPMVIHSTSHWALDAADRFMLEHYLGREAVGVYTVAYGSTSTLLMVNASINSAYVPQFIRAQGQPDGARFVAKSVTYLFVSVLAATLGFVIFAPLVIRTLYAARFAEAAQYSPILALAAPLHAVYLVYVNVLFFVNRTSVIPFLTLTAGIVNVAFNAFMIPRFGLFGAVLATVVGYAALAIAFRLGTWQLPHVLLEKSRLIRVIVVFLAIAVAAQVLDGRFSLAVEMGTKIVLALLAPLLLWASRFMTAEEKALVMERLSSLRGSRKEHS